MIHLHAYGEGLGIENLKFMEASWLSPAAVFRICFKSKAPVPGKLPASFLLQKVWISGWSRAKHVHQSCTRFQGVEQDRAGVGQKNSEFCEPRAETGAEGREDVNPPGPVHPTGQKASGPVSVVTVVIAFSFLFFSFPLIG